MKTQIQNKVKMGLQLTERERSLYLLYIASDKEAREFIERGKAEQKPAKIGG